MKRLLFRMARGKGSEGGNDKDGQVKLMYIDVKKAHLNGEEDDDFAYITLELEERRLRAWTCCADGIHEQGDRRQGRGLGRRLDVLRQGEVPQGNRGEDGRVV